MKFGRRIDFYEKVIRTHFAFFPTTIKKETRWLEKVTIEGYYWKGSTGTIYWESVRFID